MVDYVIVGAGSAGCVLAGRLVSAGHRVALVEAGGSDERAEIRVPAAFTKLFKTACDWGYSTAAQPTLDGRELFWPRGKVLGGCSSMNAQMWSPGYPADYDGWAACGNPGWGWHDVRPYLARAARQGPSDDLGIAVTPLRAPNPATEAFLRACEGLGLPRLGAPDDERPEGFAPSQVTQRRGARFSAVDGYLRPVLKHPRLSLLLGARVERVLTDGRRRALGVALVDAEGRRRDLWAAREVVLAAGAINSPQLLMLSGIGDPDALARHAIPLVCALPGVGRNLQDHLLAAVVASCPRPVTLASAATLPQLLRYAFARTGMLTSNVAEAYAFVRTRPELRQPDVELVFAPTPFIDHGLAPPPCHGITVGAVLLQPESRGRVELRSGDPADAPRIDPAYLSDASGVDLRTLVAGVKLARRVLSTAPLRDFVDGFLEPSLSAGDDVALAEFVRTRAETLYHPVGTCRMGDDEGAVVDAALRVRGVERLRVVDASVMPRIIRGHTHAPTVAIAEKAAELMAADARRGAAAAASLTRPAPAA